MKTSIFVLLFTLLLAPKTSQACSCAYAGKFIDYSSNRFGVIRVTILSYGPKLAHGESLYETMAVNVTEVIKGEFSYKKLTLIGDPGHLCRDYIDSNRFEIGSEHLISIRFNKPTQELGGCGESSVSINNDTIEGYEFQNGKRISYSIPLDELINRIKKQARSKQVFHNKLNG